MCVLTLWGPVPHASADPLRVNRDRSDNRHVFEWDAVNDVIGAQSSSTVVHANDPVTFYAFARRSPDPASRRPLVAELTLTLNAERARRYAGRFQFVVRDADGDVIRRRAKHKDLVLRPTSGARRKQVRFWFNLPESGTYSIIGRFKGRS